MTISPKLEFLKEKEDPTNSFGHSVMLEGGAGVGAEMGVGSFTAAATSFGDGIGAATAAAAEASAEVVSNKLLLMRLEAAGTALTNRLSRS